MQVGQVAVQVEQVAVQVEQIAVQVKQTKEHIEEVLIEQLTLYPHSPIQCSWLTMMWHNDSYRNYYKSYTIGESAQMRYDPVTKELKLHVGYTCSKYNVETVDNSKLSVALC